MIFSHISVYNNAKNPLTSSDFTPPGFFGLIPRGPRPRRRHRSSQLHAKRLSLGKPHPKLQQKDVRVAML